MRRQIKKITAILLASVGSILLLPPLLLGLLLVVQVAAAAPAADGPSSLSCNIIHVNVFDRQLQVSGVSTVGELQLRIQQETGIYPKQQGHVMLGKTRLSPLDVLSEVGVTTDGTTQLHLALSSTRRNKLMRMSRNNGQTTTPPPTPPTMDSKNILKTLLHYSRTLCFQGLYYRVNEGWLGVNGAPSLEDALERLQKLVKSPFFFTYMTTDPKELFEFTERFRQKLLESPTVQKHLPDAAAARFENVGLPPVLPPRVRAAIHDPIAWRDMVRFYIEEFKQVNVHGPGVQKLKEAMRRVLDSQGVDKFPFISKFLSPMIQKKDT